MIDQHEQKIETPDEKPKEDEPKPPEPPIGTNIKGDGKGDSFGLSGSGGSGFGGGGGSQFDWYAGQVQRRVADALRNNSKTREASLSVKVRVWTDASGRIARAELAGSTGDPSLDETLRSQSPDGAATKRRAAGRNADADPFALNGKASAVGIRGVRNLSSCFISRVIVSGARSRPLPQRAFAWPQVRPNPNRLPLRPTYCQRRSQSEILWSKMTQHPMPLPKAMSQPQQSPTPAKEAIDPPSMTYPARSRPGRHGTFAECHD